MSTNVRSRGWYLGLGIAIISSALGSAVSLTLVSTNCAIAQITPDATLPNNSTVKLEGNTRIIEGGTKADGNLFHSFREFSVPTASEAYFNNTADIQNIISRITGWSISNIDGLIRANGSANLFLINPNGIIFGPNAFLNIGGSFVASTASSFRFSNGSEFSATNPQAPPLLTVNLVPGLQYGFTQPDSRLDNAGRLEVGMGKSLTLHGGTITSTGSLIAPGGAITLEAKGNIFTGNILTGNNLTAIRPPFTLQGGAIRLSSKDGEINTTAGTLFSGSVDTLLFGTSGVGGGAIILEAKGNISTGNIVTAIPSLTSKGGAIRLSSKDGEINTTAGTPFFGVGGVVNGEAITPFFGGVDGGAITLFSGGVDGGAITLEAKGNISTKNIVTAIPSQFIPQIPPTQNGGAIRVRSSDGEINTTAGNLFSGGIVNGGAITLEAKGNIGIRILDSSANTTKAGDINITSNAEVYTVNDGIVLSETQDTAQGGDINITSRSLVIQGGTRVSPSTRGSGKGGNLTIHATDFVKVSGVSSQENNNSGLFNLVINSPSPPKITATGDGGDITIETGRLIVEDGGQISASASRGTRGNAGKLTVKAAEVEVSGVAPPSFKGDIERGEIPVSAVATATIGEGNGGKLDINTGRLIIRDGAVIATATGNTGDGGSLTINASEFVKVMGGSADGRFISALSADTIGAGNAGNLTLTTGKLILSNGGGISASTVGSNPGGNISITATDSVQIQGTAINGFASGVYAQTFADGKGGNVTINTGQLTISDRATITAASRSATDTKVPTGFLNLIDSFSNSNATVGNADNLDITAKGNAGNLDITANSILLNNQGSFLTSTASGQGGDIRLQVRDILLLRRNSQISTTAGVQQAPGNGGNITINDSQNRRGFVVAAPNENSNITANAFQGSGGKVQINTTGIFGMTVLSREDLVRLSGTNDLAQLDLQLFPSSITAISQTSPTSNGQVTLNTPDVDPSRGLVQLPTNLVDASQQIDQSCTPGSRQVASSFIVTGRGGLPLSPTEPLQDSTTLAQWVRPRAKPENPPKALVEKQATQVSTTPQVSSATGIVEANGWVVDANGDIVLVATAPNVSPPSQGQTPTSCSAP